MKLKILERYKDLALDRYVEAGETIEVTPARHKEMLEKEKKLDYKVFEEVKEEKKKKAKPSEK